MIRKLLLFSNLIFSIVVQAQNSQAPEIRNITVSSDDKTGNLLIKYDFVNQPKTSAYQLNCGLKLQTGNSKFPAIKYSESTLNNSQTLKTRIDSKSIMWNPRSDGLILDDIGAIELCLTSKPHISLDKHLLKSLLYPGLGDYKLRNGKGYWTYGFLSYALMGGGLYVNYLANLSYNEYQNSFDVNRSNYLYNFATNQKRAAYALGIASLSIWVFDLAGVAIKTFRLKQKLTLERSRYYYSLSQQPVCFSSSYQRINTKNDYDLLCDRGDKLAAMNDFVEAKETFTSALSKFPDNHYARERIQALNATMDSLQAIAARCASLIQQGDLAYKNAQLDSALAKYYRARTICVGDTSRDARIAEITAKLVVQKLNADFNDALNKAKSNYVKGLYSLCISYCDDALRLKPNESEVSVLKQNAEKLQKKQEQDRIEKEYKDKVALAQTEINGMRYENAIVLLKEAAQIKPNETYTATKIAELEKLIASSSYPINQWSKWQILYDGISTTVEIQFNLSSESCDAGGFDSKFRVRVTGLMSGSQTLRWKMDYINCYGQKEQKVNEIPIGQSAGLLGQRAGREGTYEDPDKFVFKGYRITRPFYDVRVSN